MLAWWEEKKVKTYERGDDISAFSMKSEKFLPSLIGESNPRTSLMLVFENMSHIIRIYFPRYLLFRGSWLIPRHQLPNTRSLVDPPSQKSHACLSGMAAAVTIRKLLLDISKRENQWLTPEVQWGFVPWKISAEIDEIGFWSFVIS